MNIDRDLGRVTAPEHSLNNTRVGPIAKARQGFSHMKLEIAGGILLTAAAAASACGGGSAEGQATNGNGGVKIEPAVTATKTPDPSPTVRTRSVGPPLEASRVAETLAQIPKLKQLGLIPDENSSNPNDRNTAISFRQNTLPLLESADGYSNYSGRQSTLGIMIAYYYTNRTQERLDAIRLFIDAMRRDHPFFMEASEKNLDPSVAIFYNR